MPLPLRTTTLLAALVTCTNALYNGGVARLPVMGFNPWNSYQCNIDEELMLNSAKQMESLGLKAVGYNWVNLDDCYSEKQRSESGEIIADKVRFKGGMRNLTDAIHKLGFKTGIYSDSGYRTCADYPGSWGHEEQDAKTFFEDWGFDYLKYDNCNLPPDNVSRLGTIGRYKRMANAIAKVDRPIILSLCQWGLDEVWLWGKEIGQSWRTTWDIESKWSSIAHILDINSFITQASDFYGHNDMDMLQVGNNGLNYEEAKTHFTAWALMKSPLLIGTDLSKLTPEMLSILKNEEIIAISQDNVTGTSVSPFKWGINPNWVSNWTHPAQYWSGRTQNGTVFMSINTLDVPARLAFNLTESPWIDGGRQYSVRDLWSHTDNGTAIRRVEMGDVPPHGVVALLLRDAGNEPDDAEWRCPFGAVCDGNKAGGGDNHDSGTNAGSGDRRSDQSNGALAWAKMPSASLAIGFDLLAVGITSLAVPLGYLFH